MELDGHMRNSQRFPRSLQPSSLTVCGSHQRLGDLITSTEEGVRRVTTSKLLERPAPHD